MGSFWEELEDAFKTKSERDEERSEELRNALEAEKEVTKQLEELEKQYQKYLNSQKKDVNLDELFPPTLGLEKIEFTPESDQSITDRANAEISANKTKDVGKTESKYSSKISDVEKDMFSATVDKHEKDDEIYKAFTQQKKNQRNDSIKKGMARGSVLTSLLDDIVADETKSYEEVESAYISTIQSLNKEMEALEIERDKAMNELDLKYATELKEKIAELKEDRDAIVAKYTKYNNSVDEKERNYAIQRQEDIAKYLDEQRKDQAKREEEQRQYEAKYGYSGEKLKNYSERYNLAFEFYMSLSADIAAEALAASPNMKFYLGNYYDKLMDELVKRQNSNGGTRKYYS